MLRCMSLKKHRVTRVLKNYFFFSLLSVFFLFPKVLSETIKNHVTQPGSTCPSHTLNILLTQELSCYSIFLIFVLNNWIQVVILPLMWLLGQFVDLPLAAAANI